MIPPVAAELSPPDEDGVAEAVALAATLGCTTTVLEACTISACVVVGGGEDVVTALDAADDDDEVVCVAEVELEDALEEDDPLSEIFINADVDVCVAVVEVEVGEVVVEGFVVELAVVFESLEVVSVFASFGSSASAPARFRTW